MKNKEKKVINEEMEERKERIISIIKLAIFLGILVATYIVADKFIEYIITVDKEILKRVLNIILVAITSIIYLKSK